MEEIITRNNNIINGFLEAYKNKSAPINVKFRDLIPELRSKERYTHLIHKYPAKLLVHIPYLFVNNTILSSENDIILDPFVGTGTVYLESILSGRKAYGADSNPLARLISKVKVTSYDIEEVTRAIEEVVNKALVSESSILPEVRNVDFWFPLQNRKDLAKLLYQIKQIINDDIRDFLLVAFSNCIKKVSYADPRIAVPVKLNPARYTDALVKQKVSNAITTIEHIDVISKFKDVANDNLKRSKKLKVRLNGTAVGQYISNDARKLFKNDSERLENNSIQLIITSPPYAGAQKYIRSSSLNLGWTELAGIKDLRELDKKNIGRENYYKRELIAHPTGIPEADEIINKIASISMERATVVSQYIVEMKEAIDEMIRVLKKDGYIVMVIGNNKVCNLEFNTQQYLCSYMLQKGLTPQFKLIDDISSYGLMTKRNKTASVISREFILVFKK